MTQWPLESDCMDFYGDPRGTNAKVNQKWVDANIVRIRAPFDMVYCGIPVTMIQTHRLCKDALRAALVDAWNRVGGDIGKARDLGMTDYGGSFNFRLKRTSSDLSMHAFGCAFDFNPSRNPLGKRNGFFTADHPLVIAFKAQGFTWGGDFKSTPDAMHFQAARVK